MGQTENIHKMGDVVWCLFGDEYVKGFVKDYYKKEDIYIVDVFLPETKDERGVSYIMKDKFKPNELKHYSKKQVIK